MAVLDFSAHAKLRMLNPWRGPFSTDIQKTIKEHILNKITQEEELGHDRQATNFRAICQMNCVSDFHQNEVIYNTKDVRLKVACVSHKDIHA